MNEWIKCSDRLPDQYDFVLVFADNKGTSEPKPIAIARHNGNQWEFLNEAPLISSVGAYMDIEYAIDFDDITHWMPLPKHPEKIKCENHMWTWMPKDKKLCLKCGEYE